MGCYRSATLGLASALLVAAACGGTGPAPGKPSEILTRADVKALLQDAYAKAQALPEGSTKFGLTQCTYVWLQADAQAVMDYSVQHPTDPKYAAPDLVGTWAFEECGLVATSDAVPASGSCGGTVTWVNQADGKLEQENTSASTSGAGDVSFVAGGIGEDNAYLVQDNHASGAGCSQELVNLLQIGAKGTQAANPNRRYAYIFAAVLGSTCPSVKWKCSFTALDPR